jgi:enoyl-[acyl-carrier protein] reductase/trans-2-enoyl-CoA reductase (NAD+)
MKEAGNHEDCIEQIQRLFAQRLDSETVEVDDKGRIRIDDWEMQDDIQALVAQTWKEVSTENLREVSDFDSYQKGFLKLFGFGLDGVDYTADTETHREVDLVG